MNLSENLKKIRKEHNLSQEQLAEKLGVSRQAVSKWESNQAYPEMDKVIQLSKMFNLNIDELLNQDVKEINNEKQSKTIINKYIDDFLNFITKTIDMFSSMKFKNKCKCIIEQLIIGGLLALLFLIIGSILNNIIFGLFNVLPDKILYPFIRVLESIYLIFSLTLGIILLIHIFKVRYLDYYVIVKENDNDIELAKEQVKNDISKEEITKEKDKKILLEKKQEKIIIRDPKHSEYKFISGLLKLLLVFIKSITSIILLTFCISLICLVLSLVVLFLISKTGLFFLGILLTILSFIIINIDLVIILYNFIFTRKNNKRILLLTIITSLLICGTGIGLSVVGFTQFNYYEDICDKDCENKEFIIEMQDNLIIHDNFYYSEYISFVEEDRNDIKITYTDKNYYNLSYYSENYNNYLHLYFTEDNSNYFSMIRKIIKDINDKKIIDYSNIKITIYTSKENIEKLQTNKDEYYKFEEERNNYYNRLQEENDTYQNRIRNLEEELSLLKSRLNEYEITD